MEKNSYSAVKADRQPDKMLKCILNGISILTTNIKINLNSARYMEIIH
jgi:hypothetical protein